MFYRRRNWWYDKPIIGRNEDEDSPCDYLKIWENYGKKFNQVNEPMPESSSNASTVWATPVAVTSVASVSNCQDTPTGDRLYNHLLGYSSDA